MSVQLLHTLTAKGYAHCVCLSSIWSLSSQSVKYAAAFNFVYVVLLLAFYMNIPSKYLCPLFLADRNDHPPSLSVFFLDILTPLLNEVPTVGQDVLKVILPCLLDPIKVQYKVANSAI